MNQDDLENLFDELIVFQKEKLLKFGRKIVPNLTSDDVLQPNDFPELENHPLFRYEEGVLEGLLTAQMSYISLRNEKKN
jgi:hypothetical protein